MLPYKDLINLHSKCTHECILRNLNMELNFFWFIHTIGHTASDDGGGIATGNGGVDVKAVYVPVILCKPRKQQQQNT